MKLDLDLMNNVLKTGAIAPVSEHSSRNMIDSLKKRFDKESISGGTLIELGSGTGNLTHYLIEQGWGTLYAFEIIDRLVEKLNKRYALYDHVTILQEQAINLDKYVDTESVDCIVSTIPMTFLEKNLNEILEKSRKALKPGGIFLMGQVRSSQNQVVEKNIGPQIYKKREWLSLPPILVTAYQKQ